MVPMRLFKRIALVVATFTATLTTLLIFEGFSSGFGATSAPPPGLEGAALQRFGPCDVQNAETWRETKSKYATLREDKFTIVISTFHRPKELKRVLDLLLSANIPSLLEIVVLWNNFDDETPAPFQAEGGVDVRYRKPPRDSLNEKLYPDPEYRTTGILLSDDDVYYRPSDLEFVFQTWRKFGKDRLTGALSRCASPRGDGLWEYSKCAWFDGGYSMVLTNLAFTHVGFLDYYINTDNAAVASIRSMVDERFNCEDIALNYVASLLTGDGPLLVRGHDQYVNLDPSTGISQQWGHKASRSDCLNDFAEALQCMPLVTEEGRVERGYRHNMWYKSIWDRIA